MLRVMRLPEADLQPEAHAGLESLNDFVSKLPVTEDAKSLIALCQFDEGFINFYVRKQGGVEVLPCGENGPEFTAAQSLVQYNYHNRREALLNCPVDPNHPAAVLLKQVLTQPQHMVVIDHTEPVLVPFLDKHVLTASPAAATSTLGAGLGAGAAGAAGLGAGAAGAAGLAAGTGGSWLSRILGGLVVLLFLLALGGAYYAFLYPWPWVREEQVVSIVKDLQRQEAMQNAALKYTDLQTQIADKIDQIYTVQGDKEAQGPVQALALLDELKAQDQAVAVEAERLVNGVRQAYAYLLQAQAQDAEKAQLEAQAKLAEEAKVEALAQIEQLKDSLAKLQQAQDAVQAEQAAKEAQSQDLAQAQAEQAAASSNANNADSGVSKPLPKCETVRKAGTLPQLMLAVDGSGSMTANMSDGQVRIDSAVKAAQTLVDRVDKNVKIRFYGIQGCPFVTEYGSFTSSERPHLKGLIKSLDPRKYANPGFVFTPLVSALQAMTKAAPSNADAVGIVISDGLDTCYDAPGFNICSLAQQIHSVKPRLKIHVIYIGDPIDIDEIKCVPQITKGKIFSPNNTQDLIKDIENASQTLVKVCQ